MKKGFHSAKTVIWWKILVLYNMKPRNLILMAALLLFFSALIHFYSMDSQRVEWQYSSGFFPVFAAKLRMITGWLPISIGDIFYGLLVIWLIFLCWRFLKTFLVRSKKPVNKIKFYMGMVQVVIFLSSLYIIFNIFWGINYNRKGIAWQLGLEIKPYNSMELKAINCLLIDKVNESKTALLRKQKNYPSNKQLYIDVSNAYESLATEYPYLKYKHQSIKTSLWGWLGNYTGFTGYYNPFTGEAQLNTTIPAFLHPFIACHEVAHQLGYAKEMEANFVGYLAATASSDTIFQYSVYLDLLTYANRNLFAKDSSTAKLYRKELLPEVIKDLTAWREFNRRHQSIFEPVVRWLYGKYLQKNEQPMGIKSYDEVTGFIIAFYKKFGYI